MTLDLTDDQKLALTRLLHSAIDDDRYPLSPRLATLLAILAKLDPPPPRTEPPPALKSYDAPVAAGRLAPAISRYSGPPMTLGNAPASGKEMRGLLGPVVIVSLLLLSNRRIAAVELQQRMGYHPSGGIALVLIGVFALFVMRRR